jgi:GTPase
MSCKLTRFGYVAFVGRPNVGKSTLINRILGQKLVATSRKAQTTRHRILGVYTKDCAQLALIDLPGIHARRSHKLNALLNKTARAALDDADVLALLVDAGKWTEEDDLVIEAVATSKKPKILLLNKIDLIKNRDELLPLIDSLSKKADFAAVVPLSAEKGINIEEVLNVFTQHLPEAPFMFSEDDLTDRSINFLCSEFIREKVHRLTGQEIPYATAIKIDSYQDEGDRVTIHAVIWVDRPSQKKIVIGKQGALIKRIGTEARIEIEKLIEKKVNLQLWVKVKSDWQNSDRDLLELGIE